jgi:hypothetical protein
MKLAAIRRRWWVIVAATLAVVGIAYGIALLRARTSTAEAVAIVASGAIDNGPGRADQAGFLAPDYAGVIPQDDSIIRAVSSELGVDARGRISAVSHRNSSIIRLGFRANDPRTAIAGARAVAAAVSGPGPRTEAIIPHSIVTVREPTQARREGGGEFTSQAIVTVKSGGPSGPGYGDQVTKYAPSYASAIPDDARVLAFVARRLGTSVDSVQKDSTVKNDKDTAVLRMRYKASSDSKARAGAQAFADAVTGPTPVAASVPPSALTLVRVGDGKSPSVDPAVVLPVGVLLGLCLAVILLLALERADPRLDDADRLEDELNCPVLAIEEVTPNLAGALLDRWRVLAPGDHPTIALIPVSPRLESATATLADRLVKAIGEAEEEGTLSGPLRLVLGPAPGHDVSGASIAASSDATVLVAAEGDRLADLRATRQVLNKFEAPVQWGLLLTRSARRSLEQSWWHRRGESPEHEDVASV